MKNFNRVRQFGREPEKPYQERLCAYAVIFHNNGNILTLKVNDYYHLPGGGIHPGEDPMQTVIREAWEEAGCEISDLDSVGQANQFFQNNPLNKIGTFYLARMISIDPTKRVEPDHIVTWLTPEQFIAAPSGDFQKWAVKEASKRTSGR